MTPRVDAWMRQATRDWAVAELTAQQGFHSQACYHYGQSAYKALKEQLIPLGSLPPYSHALDRLVDSLEAGGVDVSSIRTLQLKALSRMTSRTRYPSENEAPADRFDAEDSDEARSVSEQVMAFAKAAFTKYARFMYEICTISSRFRAFSRRVVQAGNWFSPDQQRQINIQLA